MITTANTPRLFMRRQGTVSLSVSYDKNYYAELGTLFEVQSSPVVMKF